MLTDSNKKEIVQHRNTLLPYYLKEYALRELTQLYSLTSLEIVQNNSDIEQNQSTDKNKTLKPIQQNKTVHQTKNREMIEKILPQDQNEKSEHKESSRLRSQPRKNYKTFIPQSKKLKKVEF